MKKRTAISKLYLFFSIGGVATAIALLFNACSPITPSATKFAGIGGAREASSGTGDLSTLIHDQNTNLENAVSFSYGNKVHTRVVSRNEIQSMNFIGASSELSTTDLSEFMSTGLSEFNASPAVMSMENRMLTADVYVYFVTANLDLESRIELQNETAADVEFCGTNLSKVCGSDFRIELELPNYSGDPVQDTSAEHPRNILMHNLIGIVLEFRSN